MLEGLNILTGNDASQLHMALTQSPVTRSFADVMKMMSKQDRDVYCPTYTANSAYTDIFMQCNVNNYLAGERSDWNTLMKLVIVDQSMLTYDLLQLDEAVASRTVFAIVSESDGNPFGAS